MKKIFLVIISVFSLCFFAGCTQNQVDLSPRISDPHILVENPSLYNWLELQKVNYFKREDGLIVVEAKFKSLSHVNEKLAYKIDWMDKNGFTKKSILSRWIVSEVERGRSFIINAIAPSMKIENFEIRLQEPTSDDKQRKDSYHNQYQN